MVRIGLAGAVLGALLGLTSPARAVPPNVATFCLSAASTYVPCDSGLAFSAFTPMTVGASYAAGRSIQMVCTAAGNVSLEVGGAADVVPVAGATGGTLTILHFAVTAVNSSGTTATCTYANLN